MFCVKCGKEGETFDGVCMNCFLDGKQLVSLPHHIDLERCTNCEEFRVSGQWVRRYTDEAAKNAVRSELVPAAGMRIIDAETSLEELDERNLLAKATVRGKVGDRNVSAHAETTVRLKNNVCPRCSRQLGNYYESILQIRSGARELSDEIRDATVRYVRGRIEHMAEANRGIFMTKVEEVQGGIDLFLSSISLGKTLAKEISDTYGAETKESAKLIGKADDGTDMYRVTYLVRMPEYHLNDVVIYEGDAYKLSGIGKGNGKLIRLKDNRETAIRRSQMSSLKVHTPHDKLMKATVVSRSKNEIQILHPTNYATIDIRIPVGAPIGETVNIADIDGTIFFVP